MPSVIASEYIVVVVIDLYKSGSPANVNPGGIIGWTTDSSIAIASGVSMRSNNNDQFLKSKKSMMALKDLL